MTWALCFNCGEVKFGAICPCPKCEVESTGDINLDIVFSDHNMTKSTLEDFGRVVKVIRSQSNDDDLCFWAFIRYVSVHHSSILCSNLDPELEDECDDLLSRVELPKVTIVSVLPNHFEESRQTSSTSSWWKFWQWTRKKDGV